MAQSRCLFDLNTEDASSSLRIVEYRSLVRLHFFGQSSKATVRWSVILTLTAATTGKGAVQLLMCHQPRKLDMTSKFRFNSVPEGNKWASGIRLQTVRKYWAFKRRSLNHRTSQ